MENTATETDVVITWNRGKGQTAQAHIQDTAVMTKYKRSKTAS